VGKASCRSSCARRPDATPVRRRRRPVPVSPALSARAALAPLGYNVTGDKTHNAGDGTHCGWLPAHNPLFCASGLLGTCLFYHLLARLEPFPKVTEERGRNYKWLPLIIDATATFSLDVQKALLPLRPVGAVPQNACWNQLYSLAGYKTALGDAVTHVGRAAAQQEAEDAMLPAAVVNEALGYSNKEAKKDHYTPQMPLAFQLQRAGFSFDVQDFQEADAAHLRALRAHPAVVKDLIDRLLPELCAQEECVARIRTTAKSTDREAVMQQKKDNRDSGVREHRYALNPVSLAWHPGTLAPVGASSDASHCRLVLKPPVPGRGGEVRRARPIPPRVFSPLALIPSLTQVFPGHRSPPAGAGARHRRGEASELRGCHFVRGEVARRPAPGGAHLQRATLPGDERLAV